MAQSSSSRVRVIGDYLVDRQIGSGSFSVVWHAKHRVHGTEVAIKEIVTVRLNKKLEESLMSEIHILGNVNHPNIIHLYDMIQEPGKIHLVLEYCKGGDLSMFLQKRQGRIPETTAKHFMLQLASGLKILRDNNLIHRDLKPQNLLLSSDGDNSVLKIADFGFARSLQPRNLAETLCGSPLYMAPEIMQLQKYDAKADLWSVGAILFQLVTGKTPFTGSTQIQLLQNIMRSTELRFPLHMMDLSLDCIDLCQKLLRRNPVERLTFEEFFNHPFLSRKEPNEMSSNMRSLKIDGLPTAESNYRCTYAPFTPDDDSHGPPDGSSSHVRRPSVRSTHGFSLDKRADGMEICNSSSNMDLSSKHGTLRDRPDSVGLKSSSHSPSEVVDSLELIEQDYVIVSCPSMDSSSLTCASKLCHLPSKFVSPPLTSRNTINIASSDQVAVIVATTSKDGHTGSFESHSSAPSRTELRSLDIGDSSEQPSTDCMTRIKSLWNCASTIKELVNEKVEAGKNLEAFSIQLVILAIWKQALRICHTQAASAIEENPRQKILSEITNEDNASPYCHLNNANSRYHQDVYSQIERTFLLEVGKAEELAGVIDRGNIEMPDAMEIIFQAALALGRNGAVDEYMGNTENAAVFYSKSVHLLNFLLVEGPSLILNPPFALTNSDRYRLQTYIEVLKNRQSHSRSQRMALLKGEDQQHSPP